MVQVVSTVRPKNMSIWAMKKSVSFVAHRHMGAVAPTVPRQSIVMGPVVTNAAGVAQRPWAVAAYTVHLRSMKNKGN